MENKYYVKPSIDTSRYAEQAELERDYTKVQFRNSSCSNTAAGIAAEVYKDEFGNVTGALVDGTDTNTIIVSNSGSGKTTRVLSEYILSCIYAKESMVIHDPKSDLYQYFKILLEKHGYEVRVLNLRDPMTGDRWNPLEQAARLWKEGNEGRAIEMARNTAETLYIPIQDKNDKFWTESSISYFISLFIVACQLYEPEYVTFHTIYRIHIEGLERPYIVSTVLQTYMNVIKGKAYELSVSTLKAPEATRTSIFSVFGNGLSRIVLNEEITDMLTASSFDVDSMVKKPMALFIITRDEAPEAYSTVVSSIFDMIYTTLIDLAQKEFNNHLPRTVHLIMEEFGNIGKLENINNMMTASRSRNIRIVVVLQSLCQLYQTYSEELANVLIGNSQNLVYLASSDMALVKLISERCGTVYDEYTKESRPLLSPDRLTHLDKHKGETLMLLDRHYPHITNLPYISDYKMIEPLERVEFARREKIKVPQNLLTKAVEKIETERCEKETKEEKLKEDEMIKRENMSRKKKIMLPSQLSEIMEKIIKEVIE